jgi:2-C-methyl-D-erythritol 4-phosphate cytidylyltransferase
MGGRRKPFLELAGEPVLLHALVLPVAPAVVAVRVALGAETRRDPPLARPSGRARRGSFRAAPRAPRRSERRSTRWGRGRRARARRGAPPRHAAIIVALHRARRERRRRGRGWPASDTLKLVDGERRVQATPDRTGCGTRRPRRRSTAELLRRAYAAWDGREATDDATLVERVGGAS